MSMFQTYIFKDAGRAPDQKRQPISAEQLFKFSYEETALPYFELIPGKLLSDPRYAGLSRLDKGDFLRLIMLMWLDKSRYVRCPDAMALEMGMEPAEWEALEKRLLDAKLLVASPDVPYIIQPSLREQFLFNRQSRNNKKRQKSTGVDTGVDTDVGTT